MRANKLGWIAGVGLAMAAAGCNGSGTPETPADPAPAATQTAAPVNTAPTPITKAKEQLDARKYDYNEALRTAALKLIGNLPTLVEIKDVEANGKAAYEKYVDAYLADPRFGARMVRYWRDTLKTGGDDKFDYAARFAAMVVVQNRPFTDLFTAMNGTCPTFDGTTFTPADCTTNAPAAGILNDAGLMAQYYSNLAFRRVRFVQETFACSKFPAELSSSPVQMQGGAYTSPWKFESIAGGTTAKVNFQDTSSVICANCHTTLNHQAPLFAMFDEQGLFTPGTIQVKVPVSGTPTAVRTDWLPDTEQTYWRNGGAPVLDVAALGREMAKDPIVASCAVNRVWDWAMSRGDIVNDAAIIPDVVTRSVTDDFVKSGLKLKTAIRSIFTNDDFVKF